MSENPALTTVSPAHQFDQAALQNYLADKIDGFQGDVTIRQFTAGQK